MAWYAYCITEQKAFQGTLRARRPFLIPNLKGINNSPVFGYPSGDFAVVVTDHVATGPLDQKAILDHARVVGDCFRQGTVLPFRFGTVFNSDDELRRAVRVNRKAFLDSVSHLRGKSEMHLKLVLKDDALNEAMIDIELPNTAGGEYLTKLREQAGRVRERQTRARAISVQVHKLFNPLQAEISCKKIDSGGMLIDIAHLIENKAVEKYQNRFSMATRQFKGCEVALSGPWPPYHFLPAKLRTVGHS